MTNRSQSSSSDKAPDTHTSAIASGVKDTFEQIIIAFIIAFVFRAYIVEAFVIPTGSMAPTLLGEHLRISCRQCGYRFVVDPSDTSRSVLRDVNGVQVRTTKITHPDVVVICPMCLYDNHVPKGTRVRTGDRILVLKYVYNFSEPQRFDVVVFKNPSMLPQGSIRRRESDKPLENYIKRLVGLPNERLCFVDGNLYTQSMLKPDAPWRIVRKSDRPEVQRAVWQPIYHSEYVPLDGGTATRGGTGRQLTWSNPWVARAPTHEHWRLGTARDYRYDHDEPGEIQFSFSAARMAQFNRSSVWYPYNQHKVPFVRGFRTSHREPVEDIRIACTVVPDTEGLSLTLRTTARIDSPDGQMLVLAANISAQGAATITSRPMTSADQRTIASARGRPFKAHRPARVELWYVDEQASLWIDGKRVIRHDIDLPIEQVHMRAAPTHPPDVRIKVAGSPVTLLQVHVDRDIYYSGMDASGNPARGAYFHGQNPNLFVPVQLGADQFFCVGDNTPMSLDGRYWNKVNDWVAARTRSMQGTADPLGKVPRELMLGRAFYVYWPAPYSLKSHGLGILPNHGDRRFIR